MTLIGLIVAVVLCSIGCKPRRNQYGLHFMCGHHWGGLSLGCVNITDHTPSQHTLNHEFGHSIQNCMYGPLMVFITLASVTRYHYRKPLCPLTILFGLKAKLLNLENIINREINEEKDS